MIGFYFLNEDIVKKNEELEEFINDPIIQSLIDNPLLNNEKEEEDNAKSTD